MPFPLFHGYVYSKRPPKNIAYSMLPDFLGMVNASLWDKMHNRPKVQEYVLQNGSNPALDGILDHLNVDDIMNYNIHTSKGILFPIKKELAQELRASFRITGKFLSDLSEVIIEFSLDQILAEKRHFYEEFEKALSEIKPQETAEYLHGFLRRSRRKILRYVLELKTIQPRELLTLEGVVSFARRRYGFNLTSILEIGKNVKSTSLRGVLRNARLIHKLLHDPMYLERLKEIQQRYKEQIDKKFKVLLQAFEDGNRKRN